MNFLYAFLALLIVAAFISLVLSFLGILFIGTLKLIPIVLMVLALAVLFGKLKISITRGDDDNRRNLP